METLDKVEVLATGVAFKKTGKIYWFHNNDINVKFKDKVIVETIHGLELGIVYYPYKKIQNPEIIKSLKNLIRLANKEDLLQYKKNKEDAKRAFEITKKKIKKYNLPMKLLEASYTLDRSKIIFYFTAENRVDFRALVKELASILKKRIELFQVGVRDEAKIIGGIGTCGMQLCCNKFLRTFDTISLNHAKEQFVSISHSKLTGLCGRLKCCIKYEYDTYIQLKKDFPKLGKKIKFINLDISSDILEGEIIEHNIILKKVKVKLESGALIEIKLEDIKEVL